MNRRKAMFDALTSIEEDADRARLGSRAKRPAGADLMIVIGGGDGATTVEKPGSRPPTAAQEADPNFEDPEDKALDSDPTFDARPAMGRALDRPKEDLDNENFEYVDDDAPTFPGRRRRR